MVKKNSANHKNSKTGPRRLLRWLRQFDQDWVERVALLLLTILFACLIAYLPPLWPFRQSDSVRLSLILLLLLLFMPLRSYLEKLIENVWHPERQRFQRILDDYNQVVQETSELMTILNYAIQSLMQSVYAESVWIWLYHQESHTLVLSHLSGDGQVGNLAELPMDLELDEIAPIKKVQTLPESALKQGLLNLNLAVIAPMSLREELIGLIGLGPHTLGEVYDKDTLNLLRRLAGQSALAVKNSRLIADFEETVEKLELAYRRTIDAQEEERRSLAIEIHDDILGRLTTMSLALRNCRQFLATKPEQVQTWLENVETETQDINRRLREITQGLHPSVLTDLGLISALEAYMDTLARKPWPPTAPNTITLTAQGFQNFRLDERLERDVYSLTRQALDNAINHACAEKVFIHLHWQETGLSITVQDTGKGLEDSPEALIGKHGRIGLISMIERAKAWDGNLAFRTEPGKGTTVRAFIPLEYPSQAPNALQVFNQYLTRVDN